MTDLSGNKPATAAKQDTLITDVVAIMAIMNALKDSTANAQRSLLVDAASNPVSIAPNPSSTYQIGTIDVTSNPTFSVTAKATSGYIFNISGFCARSTPICLRLINLNNANAGSTVPRMRKYLKPNEWFNFSWPAGYYMSSAICFGFTTDFTAVSSNGITSGDIVGFNMDFA